MAGFGDIPERLGSLLESAVGLLQTVVLWLQSQLEVAVREKVVKPILIVLVVGSTAAAALAAFMFFAVGLLTVGLAGAIGSVTGYALGALIVGALMLAGCLGVVVVVVRRASK